VAKHKDIAKVKRKPKPRDKTLASFRAQAENANKHCERGMSLLEKSMGEVGYTAPMIATVDGEIISGSARHETAANVFGSDAKPIIIESDGKRPIVVVRKDVANAQTTLARKIALLENRTAELNLTWDAELLQKMSDVDPKFLQGVGFTDQELQEILKDAGIDGEPPADAPVDLDRAAELNKRWKCETGQLWKIGDHWLLVGDSTKGEDVERVMGGEKAQLCLTDPPYAVGENYATHDDTLPELKILVHKFFPLAVDNSAVVLLTPGNKHQWIYPQPDWALA
jgi:hypothetical protein